MEDAKMTPHNQQINTNWVAAVLAWQKIWEEDAKVCWCLCILAVRRYLTAKDLTPNNKDAFAFTLMIKNVLPQKA